MPYGQYHLVGRVYFASHLLHCVMSFHAMIMIFLHTADAFPFRFDGIDVPAENYKFA
jgi:hypothetical protein